MTGGGYSTTPEIAAMLKQATRKRFAPRTLIIQEGETPTELFFILRGSVTVLMGDSDGHELILSYLGPGEFFGELGLLCPAVGRSAYVRTRTACEIAKIGYDQFNTLIHEQPKLLLQLAAQIAKRLRATSEKLGHLAFLDVTGRIARALLQLAHDSQAISHPDGMLVRITREELGRLVNCSSKMTGKALRNLEGQGLIQAHGKSIVVIGEPNKRPWAIDAAPGGTAPRRPTDPGHGHA